MAPTATNIAAITLPKGFKLQSVDEKLTPKPAGISTQAPLAFVPPTPSLKALSNFNGTFVGNGFNTIWRPSSGTHIFDVPVRGNPPPQPPNEGILELNLTTEELAFTKTLGNVPNRGLNTQKDITLSGVSYVQVVRDVTNVDTGKADGKPQEIHFEPGLWMHVPATNIDGESLVRMGSIPHGTTINAQSPALTDGSTRRGGPNFDIDFEPNIVDITPFPIGNPNGPIRNVFTALEEANALDTPRLPQDLTKFIAAGTITQEILRNPNVVLRKANEGKTFLHTTTFTVSTSPQGGGDGIANIAFLEGSSVGTATGPSKGKNADAALMTARFWISKVQHEIEVPKFRFGEPPLRITAPAPNPSTPVPVFVVNPPRDITQPTKILVTSTQIQYTQKVNLDFQGLTWPHVSVATLVPATDIPVLETAFH